jgi:hypothetical protein
MYELPMLTSQAPVAQRVGRQLGSVVHAHELGRGDRTRGRSGRARRRCDRRRPPLDLRGKSFAGVLVTNVQELQDAAVRGPIEPEVLRPHLIRALCPQSGVEDGEVAEARPRDCSGDAGVSTVASLRLSSRL